MGKYILNRILRSLVSLVAIMTLTIVLIYSLMDRDTLVSKQPELSKKSNNDRISFKYQVWEEYGYVETYDYRSFCAIKYKTGSEEFNRCAHIDEVFTSKEKYCKITAYDELDPSLYTNCMNTPRDYLVDSDIPEIGEFIKKYEKAGYTIVRSNPVPYEKYIGAYSPYSNAMNNQPSTKDDIISYADGETPEKVNPIELAEGGSGLLFAYKSKSTFVRLWEFFSNIFYFDGKNYYKTLDTNFEMDTYIRFEKDSVTGNTGLRCNGCKNKYLLYFDNKFPFIHQNWITINLGYSNEYYKDTVEVMTDIQGSPTNTEVTYPNGTVTQGNKQDFMSCQIASGKPTANEFELYGGYYTSCREVKDGKSMMGYSFLIGIIATLVAYAIGLPIGILMAKNKGKLVDKLGICYIIFIMAVPSLAYIYIFRRLGSNLGIPYNLYEFSLNPASTGLMWTAYILPIVCLALPSIGSLMSWMRRYMIDQMNSDYVKFARAKGLSELEIFNKHIFKNAVIPLVHNIPGSLLGSLTGALITERVFGVPGVGKLFTDSIEKVDNGMLVGLTFFYAILSMASLIIGDVLMAVVDPRISFTDKGGRK